MSKEAGKGFQAVSLNAENQTEHRNLSEISQRWETDLYFKHATVLFTKQKRTITDHGTTLFLLSSNSFWELEPKLLETP